MAIDIFRNMALSITPTGKMLFANVGVGNRAPYDNLAWYMQSEKGRLAAVSAFGLGSVADEHANFHGLVPFHVLESRGDVRVRGVVRPPAENSRRGGARNSSHLGPWGKGVLLAVDLDPRTKIGTAELKKWRSSFTPTAAKHTCSRNIIPGIGVNLYPSGAFHFDVRKRTQLGW